MTEEFRYKQMGEEKSIKFTTFDDRTEDDMEDEYGMMRGYRRRRDNNQNQN